MSDIPDPAKYDRFQVNSDKVCFPKNEFDLLYINKHPIRNGDKITPEQARLVALATLEQYEREWKKYAEKEAKEQRLEDYEFK